VVGAQEGGDTSDIPEGVPRAPDGVCITPGATQNVDAVPGRRAAPRSARRRSPTERAVPLRRDLQRNDDEEDDTPAGPTGPSIELSTSDRLNRDEIQVRELALLQREVAALERSSAAPPPATRAAPSTCCAGRDLLRAPAVLRRRGARLRRAAVRGTTDEERDAGSPDRAAAAAGLRASAELPAGGHSHLRPARRDYPNYPEMDRVLFSPRLRARVRCGSSSGRGRSITA
jgi:hypothetical protein